MIQDRTIARACLAFAVLELAAAAWLAAHGHGWIALLVAGTAPSLLIVSAGACAAHHRARAEARREAQLQRGEPPARLAPCCSFWKNSDGQVHRPGCARLGEEQHTILPPDQTKEVTMAQYPDHTAVARKLLDQQSDINRLTVERDGAYRERAHLVALLAQLTDGAVIADAPDVDEPGWQIAYLTIGGRQASWHIAPRDAELFTHVEHVGSGDPRARWDGHTTEEKYAGIAAHTADLAQRCGPACAEQHTETGRCEIARNR